MYCSPSIITEIESRCRRLAGHIAHVGELRNAYGILVGKLEDKMPSGGPKRRCESNFKMDLKEGVWKSVVWIRLAEDR